MTFHKNPHLHKRHASPADLLEKRQGNVIPGIGGGGGGGTTAPGATDPAGTTAPATRPPATSDDPTTPATTAPDATTPATTADRTTHTTAAASSRAVTTATTTTDRSVVRVTSTSTSGRSLASALSISGLSASLSGALPSISASASAAAAEKGDGSGPSAGTVVGIVAGALVGLIFVSAVIGYLFRSKWGNSSEDEDRYGDPIGKTRDEYRRDSVMLGNGSDIGSEKFNDMASVAGHSTLGRNNTYQPNPYLHPGMSAAPPLPPMMPSFQPGQVVNTGFYGMPPPINRTLSPGPLPPPRALSPGPMFPGFGGPTPAHDFSYGMPPPPGAFYPGPPGSPAPGNGPFPHLNRAPSVPPMGMMRSPSPGAIPQHQMGRPLSPLRVPNEIPSRTGTPENNNVQQYFHRGHDSGSVMNHDGQYGEMKRDSDQSAFGRQGSGVTPEVRAKRTLSVRNGGLDDFNHHGGQKGQRPLSTGTDDAYGGM